MKSKPITAIAKMKSYENTVAKKMGTGLDDDQQNNSGQSSESSDSSKPKGGNTSDAVKNIQVSQTGGYGDVFYPKSPFYGGGFDTTASTRATEEPLDLDPLLQGARDVSRTSNQPISIDVGTGESFTPMGSGTKETSSDGKFVGPRERRERMRAVRQAGRQRKRGMIKEARLTGGDVADARKQAKILKAQDIKAEAERMARTNVDSYKTKFRGSGPETPKSVKVNNVSFANEAAANSSSGATARLAQNMKAANISNRPQSRPKVSIADTGLSDSTPDAFRQMRGTNPLEEKQPGIAKNRGYKMKGYGTKNK